MTSSAPDSRSDIDRAIDASDGDVPKPFGVVSSPDDARRLEVLDQILMDSVGLHRLRARDDLALVVAPLGTMRSSTADFQVHVLILLKGAVEVNYWKVAVTMRPGDIVGVRRYLPLTIRAERGTELIVLTVPWIFAVEEIFGEGVLAVQHVIPADFYCAPDIAALASRFVAEKPSREEEWAVLHTLTGMLRSGFEYCATSAAQFPKGVGRMGRLLVCIARNYADEEFSPVDAARELRCSVRTIHNVCAEHGLTFGSLLMEMRLSEATMLLVHTPRRVSDIAFSIGFLSFSHFCRAFKAFYGVSASQYRANSRAGAS